MTYAETYEKLLQAKRDGVAEIRIEIDPGEFTVSVDEALEMFDDLAPGEAFEIVDVEAYSTVEQWDEHEGSWEAHNAAGDRIVEIDALQNSAECAKWGETYEPGRAWYAFPRQGGVRKGRAANLAAARKAALAALTA